MDEQEYYQDVLRRVWELRIEIKQFQANRESRRQYTPGFPFSQMEQMVNSLLDVLEGHVDEWVGNLLDKLGQLRMPPE